MTIWKYPLDLIGFQTISMPEGAKILTVQRHEDVACLWALVDETKPKKGRFFSLYGTGQPIEDAPMEYLGTFQTSEGFFVFHVFEVDQP
jgi:hypothetical protein